MLKRLVGVASIGCGLVFLGALVFCGMVLQDINEFYAKSLTELEDFKVLFGHAQASTLIARVDDCL